MDGGFIAHSCTTKIKDDRVKRDCFLYNFVVIINQFLYKKLRKLQSCTQVIE